MHAKFRELVESLEPSLRSLKDCPPVTARSLPSNMPERGVYLFSEPENNAPLYVGRTNTLRKRLTDHCARAPGKAAFAMRLARHATGRKATYKTEGGRMELMNDPAFIRAFEEARTRIASLRVRYVEEPDPLRQCLLEVYVHVALGTPFNDFDNH
jgi:hypothetical protein